MRVKKFEAKTMKDALRMVKAELGPDAVILGARENKRSFGLGGESSFEITAAVSETTLQKKRFVESRLKDDDREAFRSAHATVQKKMIEKMVDRRMESQRQEAERVSASVQRTQALSARPRPITSVSYIDIPDETPAPRKPVDQVYARRAPSMAPAASGLEMVRTANPAPVQKREAAPQPAAPAKVNGEVRNRIRNLAREAWEAGRPTEPRAAQPQVAATPAPVAPIADRKEIDSLKNEIQRLQALIENFQKVPQTFAGAAHPGAEYGLSYDFSRSYQKLVDAGVAGDLVGEILTRASQEIDPINAKKPSIVEAWVAKWFLQNISTCARPLAGKMHVFVGPMGGGKTSQLVKTAAQLVIRDKKRIAVVSTDTTKVGSIDQLKIYCQILNVPFAVVRDKSDWQWLESQLHHVDHILVDSPGLALTAMEEIQSLRAIMPPGESNQVH